MRPLRLLIKSLVLSYAAAAPRHRRGAVAVCLAGQARSFNASGVYRNIHATTLRPLRDARHRVDVFLALDRDARHGFDYATNPLAPELVERARCLLKRVLRETGEETSPAQRGESEGI